MKSNLDHARVHIEKGENDLKTVEIGLEHGAPLDTVSFHLQQTAEKLIKAVLVSLDIPYPRTHDLDDLLDLLPPECSSVLLFRERIIGWTSYAVDMHYEIAGYP